MTESEFILYTEKLFNDLMKQIDDLESDFDCLISGNVLTIEHDGGEQIIVNRHVANQELWLAAKSGGYHFTLQEGQWLSKNGDDFFHILNNVISKIASENIVIRSLQ